MKTPQDRIKALESRIDTLAVKALSLQLAQKSDFKESEHPRADDGKFGQGSGSGKKEIHEYTPQSKEDAERDRTKPIKSPPKGAIIGERASKIIDEFVGNKHAKKDFLPLSEVYYVYGHSEKTITYPKDKSWVLVESAERET